MDVDNDIHRVNKLTMYIKNNTKNNISIYRYVNKQTIISPWAYYRTSGCSLQRTPYYFICCGINAQSCCACKS